MSRRFHIQRILEQIPCERSTDDVTFHDRLYEPELRTVYSRVCGAPMLAEYQCNDMYCYEMRADLVSESMQYRDPERWGHELPQYALSYIRREL